MPISLGHGPEAALSRRGALSALAACALAGCSRSLDPPRSHDGGWFALFSDPHIAADRRETLRGETMAENLRAVVSDILSADDAPMGVIANGDLAFKTGEPGDYATFVELTAPLLRQGLSLHATLGNHDDRTHLRRAIAAYDRSPLGESKHVSVVEGASCRLLLLDSQQAVNVTPGRLGREQLQWLETELDARPDFPAIVVVHHNINPTSESALLDTTALLDVLRPRRQAKAVVFGHTHVFNVQKIDDLHMINLPAVGYRFLAKQPLGWVALRPFVDGAEIELRCVGGDRSKDGRTSLLRWRA